MGGNGFLGWLCNRSIQVGLIYYLNTASVGWHFKRDIEFSNRRNNILLRHRPRFGIILLGEEKQNV